MHSEEPSKIVHTGRIKTRIQCETERLFMEWVVGLDWIGLDSSVVTGLNVLCVVDLSWLLRGKTKVISRPLVRHSKFQFWWFKPTATSQLYTACSGSSGTFRAYVLRTLGTFTVRLSKHTAQLQQTVTRVFFAGAIYGTIFKLQSSFTVHGQLTRVNVHNYIWPPSPFLSHEPST